MRRVGEHPMEASHGDQDGQQEVLEAVIEKELLPTAKWLVVKGTLRAFMLPGRKKRLVSGGRSQEVG
jgi:hypothetical protein